MNSEIKPIHLSINELNYELRIRGVVSNRGQDERRKILRRLFERQKSVEKFQLVDPSFSFDIEQSEVNSTLESITQLVIEFEGNKEDSVFKRAKSRLVHVLGRISRLPIIKGAEDEQERLSFKNETFAACLSLEADLYDKISDESSDINNSAGASNSCIHGVSNVQSSSSSSQFKSIPVYKWGETFSGDKSTLSSFLDNVEELRKARHVSKVELFDSARDLFTGDARCWFRQIIRDVKDWDALVEALKRDFRSPYFDDELWNNIKSRGQLRNESVVIYFAKMNELFNQLSRTPVEITKLKYIRDGLIPEYRKAVATVEFSSVSELLKIVKRLEDENYLEIDESREQPTSCSAHKRINPKKSSFQLNKNPFDKGNSNNYSSLPRLSVVDDQNNNNYGYRNDLECWNCRKKGHFYNECKSKKSKFCYRCGLSNVTVNTCTRCSKN